MFTVTVAADVPPGVYELRAAGPYGVSNARRFAVGDRDEVFEKEPKDDLAQATDVPFGATVGGRLFDVVEGVEQWQLSNAEVGLASFFFHRDYRDYFGRHGGSIYAALRATEDADLTLSYSDERWRSRVTRDPFALAMNGLAWRENPQVDAGRFHVANLTLRIDTRNDVFDPWAGWYLLADFERGVGTIDAAGPTSPGVRPSPLGRTSYQRVFMGRPFART
jgi:hypothetical protein